MNKQKKKFLNLLVLLLFFLCGCIHTIPQEESQNTQLQSQTAQEEKSQLDIYYINVGQADACLLQYEKHFMLIDAGNNKDEAFMVDFLKDKGVTALDCVVGTHPHADHIGGLDAVIENFEVKKIYMPKAAADTKTFQDVITQIENKGLFVESPEAGSEILFDTIPIQVLAPVKQYKNMNDNSIVLKLNYHNVSFLFTGDIEAQAELDILQERYDVSATGLKVAHHGSDTSSTENFIDAVNPIYAVISVGQNNKYRHPSEIVLNRLHKRGIDVYRTDQAGTIKISTDGNNIFTQ